MKSIGLVPLGEDTCDICIKGKMRALPFKIHFEKTIKPPDLLHLDVVGPISPLSASGDQYLLTIVDQHRYFKITCFMKRKSGVFEQFGTQMNLMQNHHDGKIKKIVTYGG
ncbi:hypothetical protein O181_007895 [Austropuccinia psidii MF-1]|uniref:Uncharacterized protein n=1 Tax=Austropuccinia psidii MF-1 TaxID=1389203 RepID=A0A9Q3BNX0_9BASI|nr:hypothetical protein [Austropuccinia psidii MF-1]